MNQLRSMLIGAAIALAPLHAYAQSSPGLYTGQIPTAAQWNAYFAAKQDVLGYTPLNQAGGYMAGPLVTYPSAMAAAGLNIPPGTAPNAPNSGDIWLTQTGGLYYQYGSTTIGPLLGAGSGSFGATAPLAVSFPENVVTYALNYDSNFATVSNNLAFAPIASGDLLGNCTGSSAEPTACNWNSFALQAIGSTNGILPYVSGGAWGTISTGTSGATLGLLNGNNTYSGSDIFSGTFNCTGTCQLNGTAFGTAATQDTGTSGANLGILNGDNTYSGNDVFSGTVNFTGSVELDSTPAGQLPASVSGTVNSGAIPYFSSTTEMQSSAALAANAPMFGGGAGSAPYAASGATPEEAGDIVYWNGTAWLILAGNNSGTNFLQELASGVPSWAGSSATITFPQSVSGTTHSGGVPYFSSSSILSSSAAGTANDIMLWGGAGNAPIDSDTLLSSLAPLASPTFTGAPAAPTPSAGDDSTKLATTAFNYGGWHLLNTLTASNSASLSDTTSLTGTYANYEIVFNQVVPATNEAGCYIQAYIAGTLATSGYLAYGLALSVSGASGGASTTAEIPCAATSAAAGNPSNSSPGINGVIRIHNPSLGYSEFEGTTAGLDGGGVDVSWNQSGFYNSAGAVTGIKIFMSTGNITSGTVKIYGRN